MTATPVVTIAESMKLARSPSGARLRISTSSPSTVTG